jgi:hypothetical protein
LLSLANAPMLNISAKAASKPKYFDARMCFFSP